MEDCRRKSEVLRSGYKLKVEDDDVGDGVTLALSHSDLNFNKPCSRVRNRVGVGLGSVDGSMSPGSRDMGLEPRLPKVPIVLGGNALGLGIENGLCSLAA